MEESSPLAAKQAMRDPVLLVLVTVGAVVLIALLGAKVQQRRTDLLRQAADDLGFTFRPSDPTVAAALKGLVFFGRGQVSHARNVLRGEAHGLETMVFDYHDTLRVGTYTYRLQLSVVHFFKASANWPDFRLRPRHRSEVPGSSDIAFEDDPEFSKRYVLQSENAEATRALFNDDVREFFAGRPGVWVEAAGPRLIYSTGKMLDPAQLQAFLAEGFEVLNVFEAGGPPA
jgi:hypothetical protein